MQKRPFAFLNLEAALTHPDPAWKSAMVALHELRGERGEEPRRPVSLLASPWALVIVGPNGAGKTTLYDTRISRLWPGVPFVNADILARQRLGRHPETLDEARLGQSLVSEQLSGLVEKKEDFVWETVFSHPSRLDRLHAWRALGYQVGVLVVHPGCVETSISRVEGRVQSGGHPVPEQKIRERFLRTPELAMRASKTVDAAWWMDSSQNNVPPALLSKWRSGVLIQQASDTPGWWRHLSESFSSVSMTS